MKYILLGIAMTLTGFGFAQNCTYTFKGQLTDFHDGTSIAVAAIYIEELKSYETSDINGNFTIENLCEGKLTLNISHIACEDKTITFDINGNRSESIYMEHHTEELNEVSVISNQLRTETTTAQETVLKAETLQKYSALSLGDALREVSGVSSINTGNTIVKPMINGMHSSRLLILNNGVRLQDQEWGIEHAPNIDINSANQISVIKGSGALAYGGDAIGGVIVVNPNRIILKDSLFGKTIVSGQTNGRGYSLSSSLNKTYQNGWFATIQGSYKQNGDFEAPDYLLTNTGLNSKGVTLRAGKKQFESGFELFYSFLNTEIGILRASHIGNISDLERAINSGQPLVIRDFSYNINSPKQDVTHHLIKGLYYKRFKSFGKLNLQYDYQNNRRLEFDVRRGERSDRAALDLELQTHTLQADIALDANLKFKHHFGVMGRYQNNFPNPETGVRRLIPDYDKYDFGAFFTTEYRLNDNLLLDGGLRYDFVNINAEKFYRTSRWEERGYDEDFQDVVIEDLGSQLLVNPVFDYHSFSASAGLKYTLNQNSYLLGNYSLSTRPPNPAELFSDGLHHSAARFELGDLRFEQEISNRVSATYNLSTSDFDMTFETFYNLIGDYIYIEPSGIEQGSIRGPFPVWEYRQSDVRFTGFDLTATYRFSEHWSVQDKSSLVKAWDLDNDRAVIDIPAFNTVNEVQYSNKSWNDFSASLRSEWVFEQNEFPDNNFETFIAVRDENVLIDISTPPPAYHLIHFYSDMNFELSETTHLNLALSVNNVFNTNYRNYLNQLRYFADDLGRNVMLQLQLNY